MKKLLLLILARVFKTVLDNISQPIRDKLHELVLDLERRAHSTPNKFDDQLVILLKTLLGIK
ncbi:hypothetical protein LCGC14_1797810 [marine sediment metagenome]|uniref:Uncharacterized protein n=1 Tax=marine sediment metagenome TaxID=412755 RepID=A0A0F9JQ22_9ZZZZ